MKQSKVSKSQELSFRYLVDESYDEDSIGNSLIRNGTEDSSMMTQRKRSHDEEEEKEAGGLIPPSSLSALSKEVHDNMKENDLNESNLTGTYRTM